MERLLESLRELNLEGGTKEEETYVEFLAGLGIVRFSNSDYKTYLSRISQIYNLCKGGYINNCGEVFLSNKLNNFKDRTNPISKESFFDILLFSKDIYFYPATPIKTFLTTDAPYKILLEIEWSYF
jgi:hypothetical protein